MKFLAVLVATCALTQTALVHNALAQTSECRSLPDPGQRLACYDMAAPPAKAPEKLTAKHASAAKGLSSNADIGSPEAISADECADEEHLSRLLKR